MGWQHGLPLTRTYLATAAAEWMSGLPTAETSTEPEIWHCFLGDQQATWWQVDCIRLLCKWQCLVFVGVDAYSTCVFVFLACNAFAKTAYRMNLQNASSTIWYLIQYFFWPINSLHSQSSVAVGPWLWNKLVLPCSPEAAGLRKLEWPFEDSCSTN